MKIPNFDKKVTSSNLKQLYDYMPDRCFRMLICGKSGCGKTNTVLHKKKKKKKKIEMIAEENKIPIDEIFQSSNEEIIPISEMEDRTKKW